MTRHPLVSYQPLRLLFQLSYLIRIILHLPYYTLISLIPSLRPHKTWSFKQTFTTRISYHFLSCISHIGITEPLNLSPGAEGRRFQLIPTSPLNLYKGPLEYPTIKPATTGGTWFPDLPGEDTSEKLVMLYFHGGAFVQGDGRAAQYSTIANYFLDPKTCNFVFSLQYRLSGHGDVNPFPAALQDALSSYLFLLNEYHIPARNIILTGDSAGATLATSLLRYLWEFGGEIGVEAPKCAVLLSPWVEPFYYDTRQNPHRGTDFVPSAYGVWGANAYAGPHSKTNPYITSLGNPFPTPVPIFVNAGTAELFYEKIEKWAEEMRNVEGNVVELNREEGAVHDTFFVGGLMGFEGSARGVAGRVEEFVRMYA